MDLSDCSVCDGTGIVFYHPDSSTDALVSSDGLFMTESEWKEMLKEDDDKIADMDASDRELCSHTAEDLEVSEMHTLWGCYRTLLNENKRLKDKNASLRAELREVQVRLSDMSAAVVGNVEAKDRVSHRVSLETGRNELVKLLTDGKYSDWLSYQAPFLNADNPCAAGEALVSLARDMHPKLEAQAQLPPPPAQSDSMWKSLAKYRSKEERRAKEQADAQHAERVQEARRAQELLVLLHDQGLWKFILQS